MKIIAEFSFFLVLDSQKSKGYGYVTYSMLWVHKNFIWQATCWDQINLKKISAYVVCYQSIYNIEYHVDFKQIHFSEDAEAASSRIMSLDGRRLYVTFANKKKKEKRKAKVKSEENTDEEPEQNSDAEDEKPVLPRLHELEKQSMIRIQFFHIA